MIGKVRKGKVQVIKDITEITLRFFNKKMLMQRRVLNLEKGVGKYELIVVLQLKNILRKLIKMRHFVVVWV